jgi:hypothetical protein
LEDVRFETAINNDHPCYGIIYLRLKLLKAENVIATLGILCKMNPDFKQGLLVVLDEHRMRVRQLRSDSLSTERGEPPCN